MKRWFKVLTSSLAVVLFITFSCAAFAAAPVKLRTAWLDEHEAFLVWYAKEKGWDKEEGLDIEMLLFSSGMAQLNALPAGEWVLAGTGAVPGMMGALRYGTYTIAVTNDESYTNALLLRPDSRYSRPKATTKTIRKYTDIRTTCAARRSSSPPCPPPLHPEPLAPRARPQGKRRNHQEHRSAQGLAAFDSGIGDGVCLWAPHMFFGMDKAGRSPEPPIPAAWACPPCSWATRSSATPTPELVAKFLRVFLRSANMLQKETPESLAPEYCRFFQEFVGKSFTPEMAALDIKTHPVFNLEEQLALFDGSKGQSKAAKWMADIAEFFASVGRITPDELKVVKDGSYATDKFLKLVKQPIPDYK